MPRPRVGILFEHVSLNGGERSLLAIAELLNERFELCPIAPPEGALADELCRRGFSLIPSPLARTDKLTRPDAVSTIMKTAREAKISLLHANSLAMGRLSGAIARQVTWPCTSHVRDIIRLSRSAVSDLNQNRRIVAVSHATRDWHIAQGVDADRVTVVHNGIDAAQFKSPNGVAVRHQLGISNEASVLLTVGQIGLRKAWDTLADAIALCSNRSNWHLLLVGCRYSEKPETVLYEQTLRRRFEELLPGRVHWLGFRDDLPDLLAASTVLVHPARQEPFGRVLLEAAAAGLPMIATNVGGTAEMLVSGKHARLIQPDDAPGLAAAIVEMLFSPSLRLQLTVAAQQKIGEQFTLTRAADGLMAAWDAALSPA